MEAAPIFLSSFWSYFWLGQLNPAIGWEDFWNRFKLCFSNGRVPILSLPILKMETPWSLMLDVRLGPQMWWWTQLGIENPWYKCGEENIWKLRIDLFVKENIHSRNNLSSHWFANARLNMLQNVKYIIMEIGANVSLFSPLEKFRGQAVVLVFNVQHIIMITMIMMIWWWWWWCWCWWQCQF